MKRVLLMQGTIPNYRVSVFNELSRRFDLTVLYSYGDLPKNIEFNVIKVTTFKLHYLIHRFNLYTLAKKFDVTIIMFDLSYLFFRLLVYLPRKYKVIYWGIGVSASYNQRYDEDKSNDKTIIKYLNLSDANIFYSEYPVKKYVNMGVSKEKLFVANNTVDVLESKFVKEKNTILFVGSLYKQKKIHELLTNYLHAYNEVQDIPNLIVIGDGDEIGKIRNWIFENDMEEKIFLKGAIYDERELSDFFSSAIVCISPDQAGLTVLKSMGYGVPFVTIKSAITGGEIFDIESGFNGILINSFSELKNLIIETFKNKEKFLELGRNAREFYNNNRKIEMMVNGFENAIKFVLKEKDT